MSQRPPTSVALAYGDGRPTSRTVLRLLLDSGRGLTAGVVVWLVADAALPAAVVAALGLAVGRVPGVLLHGFGSAQGRALVDALVIAAVVYAASLVVDPVGAALGTAARTRVTGRLQQRLLGAVGAPVGVGHLEDPAVLDRLARAEGSLTGYFPGDAPVTWAGVLSARVSGLIGCAVVAAYIWWMGVLLLAVWLVARRVLLTAVLRQATELRGQSTEMRRAWYFIGVGSYARDAKEVRVFGLAGFVAGRYRRHFFDSIRRGIPGLRSLHVRAAATFVGVVAVYVFCLAVIAGRARDGTIGVRELAILLPMLAVTSTAGNVSSDDITLAWTLAGLPDVARLEADLRPAAAGPAPATAASPAAALSAETAAVTSAVGPGRPLGGPPGAPRTAIRFEDVTFRYPGGARDVLAGLDLTLPVGRSTAIVGVNGAGKSTLVSLLARLRDPTAGRITADGDPLVDLDPSGWQRLVALVPQAPVRYPVSAYDNVAYGAVEHRDDGEGVRHAARRAGFDTVVAELPQGWNTILTREQPGGVDLSGGQWQRLALARALFATAHGARLLVLDEPTAALDVRSEARFYQRFLDITRGLTTVVISHRFATVRQADQICVLDGSRITERGSHDELVALGGEYARLYELQARRFAA